MAYQRRLVFRVIQLFISILIFSSNAHSQDYMNYDSIQCKYFYDIHTRYIDEAYIIYFENDSAINDTPLLYMGYLDENTELNASQLSDTVFVTIAPIFKFYALALCSNTPELDNAIRFLYTYETTLEEKTTQGQGFRYRKIYGPAMFATYSTKDRYFFGRPYSNESYEEARLIYPNSEYKFIVLAIGSD